MLQEPSPSVGSSHHYAPTAAAAMANNEGTPATAAERAIGAHTEPRESVQLASGTVLRQQAAAQAVGIPMGAILTPCLQPMEEGVRLPLPCIRRAVARCDDCGAYLNYYCEAVKSANGVKWTCVLCGRTNESRQVEHTMSPELQSHAAEYRPPHEQPVTAAAAGGAAVSPPALQPHTLVLVVDVSSGPAELEAVVAALNIALDEVNDTWELCLITFSNVVMVHELGVAALCPASTVLSGAVAPSRATLARISSSRTRKCFCGSAALAVPRARKALHALHSASILVESDGSISNGSTFAPRCTGAALATASALVAPAVALGSSGSARLLLITSGAPNVGPGASHARKRLV